MKILFLIALLFCSTIAVSQTRTTNDLSLVNDIPIKKYSGKNYRASVDIKNIPTDSTGAASFFILQVGKTQWDFITKTRQHIPAKKTDNNWHTYKATGSIAPDAHKIWLYVSTVGNGDFSYDNFKLEVETSPNEWETVTVPNGNFEQSTNPVKELKGGETQKENKGLQISLQKSDENHYLHIKSAGGKVFQIYGQQAQNGKYFTSKGTKIYYETYGKGEPLLLLHGNGGSISAFKAQIPVLAQHYQVIAVDTRAQGKSIDKTTERFSYDLFAEDMKTLLDTLHLKQVNLLGWSDGGNTGLILAMKYPDYVKKLITMGANLDPSETSVSSKILAETKKGINKLKAKNDPAEKTTLRLLEMLLTEPQISVNDLQKITAHTLVLAGEKDVILENHTRLIAKSIPKAEIMILKGQTHFVPQENPELFNQTVLDFLAKP